MIKRRLPPILPSIIWSGLVCFVDSLFHSRSIPEVGGLAENSCQSDSVRIRSDKYQKVCPWPRLGMRLSARWIAWSASRLGQTLSGKLTTKRCHDIDSRLNSGDPSS
ncbi:hypothetical protein BDP81DRAFT_438623 [Colletotrichum phormii]|uniref:Secreted protein n=1 Tax=Colletotrichum phormii TaxID=359342 RepID=A0AAI9ZGE9_9PEZI|nr:uncharacterized protein BDP81DRAFT_438623 [Colletotrichum phormii]KAK1624080.1 hypothetical protein BDP81DRAFT_438623 [Colletotrichum phormii]